MKTALKILIGLGLLALTLWLLNLAAYNAWAAGGPPEPEAYKKIFAERSNMFFGWTCASFIALAAFTIWNLVVVHPAPAKAIQRLKIRDHTSP